MKSILHDIWQDDEIKVLTGLHYKTLQPPLQALVSVVTSADLEPVEAVLTSDWSVSPASAPDWSEVSERTSEDGGDGLSLSQSATAPGIMIL